MTLREFVAGVLIEDIDVPSRHITPANPAVAVLDVSLIHALGGEITGGTLREVGERDGLGDAGVLGGVVAVVTFAFTPSATETWSVSGVAFVGVAIVTALCLSSVFGLVSGCLGGWVANSVTRS